MNGATKIDARGIEAPAPANNCGRAGKQSTTLRPYAPAIDADYCPISGVFSSWRCLRPQLSRLRQPCPWQAILKMSHSAPLAACANNSSGAVHFSRLGGRSHAPAIAAAALHRAWRFREAYLMPRNLCGRHLENREMVWRYILKSQYFYFGRRPYASEIIGLLTSTTVLAGGAAHDRPRGNGFNIDIFSC